MPKRKRKRTRIRPGPILVLLLVLVLFTGLVYSPLSSLSKTTVVGAKAVDRPLIKGILAKLNGIPWIQVNPRWVETRVQGIEAVDHATYSQNIFGRGRLEVVYRIPVARVRAGKPIGLDATGVMFETDALPDDLPIVVRNDEAKDLPLTLVGSFPSQAVADLAPKAALLFPSQKLTIEFNSEGSLCLNSRGSLVILGSSDDLDQKLQSLKEILDRQPGLLARLEKLDLTEPTHPAMTYKKQRE